MNVIRRGTVAALLVTLGGPTALAELNDTGVTVCSDGSTIGVACNDLAAGTDVLPGQDAEYGRDLTDPDDSDGKAGFSFTKLDAVGTPLADQQADYVTDPWACVEDNVTGLVWEIKTDDDGLHDKDWTYSWYTSTEVNDAGFAGFENQGSCVDDSNCDTEKYLSAVNAAALCGFSDWRLPSPTELQSIVAYGDQPLVFPVLPTVDADYFPNTIADNYFTNVSSAQTNVDAWVVYFGAGSVVTEGKGPEAVRLVRGGGM